MKNVDVIRAWKNEEYRMSLSETDRATLPGNPAGAIELNDGQLGGVSGGTWPVALFTLAYGAATGLIGFFGSKKFNC